MSQYRYSGTLHGGPPEHEGLQIAADARHIEVFAGGCATIIDGSRHYVVASYVMEDGWRFERYTCVDGDGDGGSIRVDCPQMILDPEAFWLMEDRSSSGE